MVCLVDWSQGEKNATQQVPLVTNVCQKADLAFEWKA